MANYRYYLCTRAGQRCVKNLPDALELAKPEPEAVIYRAVGDEPPELIHLHTRGTYYRAPKRPRKGSKSTGLG